MISVMRSFTVSSTRKQIKAELILSFTRSFTVSSTRKQIRDEFTYSMRSFIVSLTRKQIRAEITLSYEILHIARNQEADVNLPSTVTRTT